MKVKLDSYGIMPTKAHEEDAAFDIYTPVRLAIPPHGTVIVRTGVHIALDKGTCGVTKSRSGLNFKDDVVTVDGVIDSGYTGEIKVKLRNNSDVLKIIDKGSRISQMLITYAIHTELELVEELDDTERGAGGFGSTGR